MLDSIKPGVNTLSTELLKHPDVSAVMESNSTKEYKKMMNNTVPTSARLNCVQAVIFDWAGTVVDFGSFAPTSIFIAAFREQYDFSISLAEARVPMGLGKWDHIKAVSQLPDVAKRWQLQFGREMSDADVDAIYEAFMPLQIAKVGEHADIIPHAIEVIEDLKQQGVKIGSCSGYPRVVMDVLVAAASERGYQPDCVVATDDLPAGGRPGPFMALKNVIDLGINNVTACIKVDDAVPGIDEGHNAGMWTVGLLLSGNEAGLTLEQYQAAEATELAKVRERARTRLSAAEPHYLIDTIADLPGVVLDIEKRLAAGERP